MKHITIQNTNMIRSIQLAIIQAFTASWGMKFEQMVVILDFHWKTENNENIHNTCTKFTCQIDS